MYNNFFDFLKISIGTLDSFRNIPSGADLEDFFKISSKQSLIGITMTGLQELQKKFNSDDPDATTLLIMRWYGYSKAIEKRNFIVSNKCKELSDIFFNGGFRTCILKGQGNALYYPQPLLRNSGDIDIWVEGRRDVIINYVKSLGVNIHDIHLVHATADFFSDVTVEIHFQPSWMYNPLIENRLEKFFLDQEKKQFKLYDKNVGYTHPSLYFNLVYNLIHINRHIFDEGIGLRQVVDYFYILKSSDDKDKHNAYIQLEKLKLSKFTSALMYVMQEALGLKKELMLCKPNEKLGHKLLLDIVEGGNFGHYGKYARVTTNDQRIKSAFDNLKRNWQFISTYPEEVLWIPFFKLWHWGWRKLNGFL